MDNELLTKLKWLIDRTEIFDLVRHERFCRDQRDWKGLIDSFVPNSRVRTTWFDGPVEEFADASRRKMTGADASVAKHWIFPTKLQISDSRALVESPALIFDRLTFDGVEFDSFQYCVSCRAWSKCRPAGGSARSKPFISVTRCNPSTSANRSPSIGS